MKIIKEYFIPIDLKFHYENSKDDIFNIKESAFKEKDKDNEGKITKHEKKNKVKLCMSIEQFIDKFPNLVKYQEIEKVDIFDIQSELQIPKQIRNYIDIIKNKLKDNKFNNNHDKIFPIEPYEKDKKKKKKCASLKSLQPKDSMGDIKGDVFMGDKENEIVDNLKSFEKEKSIRKKISIINNVMNLVPFIPEINSISFINDLDFKLPWMFYFFIKAQPLKMYSNTRFVELYNVYNNKRALSLLMDISRAIIDNK